MRIDVSLLPKKLNEINYFKKGDNGCEIYSYSAKLEDRNEVIVVELKDCEIEKDFCIDLKSLEMVKVLYPCDITITDKSFIIKSNKGKYTGKLLSEGLFNLSTSNYNDVLSIDIDTLVKASGYVSKNDKKPILCGVRIDENGNVYATDSFRAYFYRESESLSQNGITIPTSFINLVKSLSNENNIKINYNNNILVVMFNNIKIFGRLLDGNYPNMSKILERKNNATLIEIDKDEICERLEIASNIGNDSDKRTIIKFTNGKIEALGNNNYEAEIKFECDSEYSTKMQFDFLDQAFKTITNDLKFKVVLDSIQKIGVMLFLENEKETCLILGVK